MREDVRQQGRQDTALGRACCRMPDRAFDHDPRLQESADQQQDLAVPDTPLHRFHQQVMIDGVETPLDVSLDDIGCRRAAPASQRIGKASAPREWSCA